jgi:hypothetical protein
MFPLNTILAWNINIIINKKYDNNNIIIIIIIIASRAYFLHGLGTSLRVYHSFSACVPYFHLFALGTILCFRISVLLF